MTKLAKLYNELGEMRDKLDLDKTRDCGCYIALTQIRSLLINKYFDVDDFSCETK